MPGLSKSSVHLTRRVDGKAVGLRKTLRMTIARNTMQQPRAHSNPRVKHRCKRVTDMDGLQKQPPDTGYDHYGG